jgi:DNA replication and repair protein RecF
MAAMVEIKIGTGRDPEGGEDGADKRISKIDGKIIKGQAELSRHFSLVWLTPQMEQLFQESASTARKFFDRLVYSFNAEHASRVNEYEFAMRERNKLLQMDRYDPIWLDALEQTMAETGVAIAEARLSTCEHINQTIHDSQLSFPKAHIKILGILEQELLQGHSALSVEDGFKIILKENRPIDRGAGRTLKGPHRSEMEVIHIEKQMVANSCSTGEQKAMLLSIVLAQARSGARWHGLIPVLLLDEVIAHLDSVRRLELFEEICQIGAQTWMTGTDASLFAGLAGKAQYFQVDNGSLSAC